MKEIGRNREIRRNERERGEGETDRQRKIETRQIKTERQMMTEQKRR
jgi:hypothetical protein